MTTLPTAYWVTIAAMFGAIIGSFLNVVIWRLPRGLNLSHPPSHCPNCDHKIRPWENIPILSFLLLRARCSGCKKPISWRYPGVEFLTAAMFALLVWKLGPTMDALAYCLFTAALIAAFFIDLELYIIPDELNTFALFVAIGLDALHIAQNGTAALLWGWMPASIFGAVICAGVFVLIQIFGFMMAGKEAMGTGDVLLARAIGALLPLRLALVSFFLAIAVGAVVGVGKIVVGRLIKGKAKTTAPSKNSSAPTAASADNIDEDEQGSVLGQILFEGVIFMVFGDLVLNSIEWVKRHRDGSKKKAPLDEDDDFEATESHIPFGPFMVVGFLLAVFFGDSLITAYMKWTGLWK